MGLVGRIQAWEFIWESFEMRRVLIFFFFLKNSPSHCGVNRVWKDRGEGETPVRQQMQ